MKRIITLFILISYLSSFISCFALGPISDEVDENYFKNLKKWTKEDQSYKEFETNLIVYATYKNLEFRRMYVEKVSRDLMLSEDQKNKLWADEQIKDSKFNEFLVVAYTPDRAKNSMSLSSSPWSVYLINDKGVKIEPLKIKREFDLDRTLAYFYPFMNVWSYGYSIFFPKFSSDGVTPFISEDTESFRMIITSVFGKCEMVWNLKEKY